MPYIDRDGSNNIIAVYASRQTDNQEFISNTVQEYLDFIEPEKHVLNEFLDRTVRPERDSRLTASDKYKLDDYPLGSATMVDVDNYRQELRDFPSTLLSIPENGMDDLVWPVNPVT